MSLASCGVIEGCCSHEGLVTAGIGGATLAPTPISSGAGAQSHPARTRPSTRERFGRRDANPFLTALLESSERGRGRGPQPRGARSVGSPLGIRPRPNGETPILGPADRRLGCSGPVAPSAGPRANIRTVGPSEPGARGRRHSFERVRAGRGIGTAGGFEYRSRTV